MLYDYTVIRSLEREGRERYYLRNGPWHSTSKCLLSVSNDKYGNGKEAVRNFYSNLPE